MSRTARIERVTNADHKSVGLIYIASALGFAAATLPKLILCNRRW